MATIPENDKEFFIKKVGSDKHTIGDFIRAVLDIDNKEDAERFIRGYMEWLKEQPDLDERGPEFVMRSNIGWCFGEGMKPERIAMWNKVCGATHPVFGTAVSMWGV